MDHQTLASAVPSGGAAFQWLLLQEWLELQE